MSARVTPPRPSARLLAAALALALALALPALEGCGKKPKLLDPPEDAGPEAGLFPRVYPRPEVEPGGPPAPGTRPEPLAPAQPYPPIIRPDAFGDPSALTLPGGNGAGWANSSRRLP
ncbi:MAG: hypothetical protein WCO00_12945 [Rhodospirillaceae bacterium]